VGDVVPLATPTGQHSYRIVAIAGEVLSMKINTIYISQANMRSDFNRVEDIFYQVDLAPGADAATAEQWLNRIVEDYPQFRLVAGREYTSEFAKQYDAIYAGFYVLLGVLAFPSLIAILNTLAIASSSARARSVCCARSARRAARCARRLSPKHCCSVPGHGIWDPGGPVSELRVRPGTERKRYFQGRLYVPARRSPRGHRAGLVFGVLAAVVPARQASRMEIIRALRYE